MNLIEILQSMPSGWAYIGSSEVGHKIKFPGGVVTEVDTAQLVAMVRTAASSDKDKVSNHPKSQSATVG